jgi:hypothetical protein
MIAKLVTQQEDNNIARFAVARIEAHHTRL